MHLKRYSEEQFKESCGDKEASRSNVVIVENSINREYIDHEDQNERISTCDDCDVSHDNRDDLNGHRRTTEYGKETEEVYFVTRTDDGRVQFTCKICETVFTSQKSVKQHTTMKHGVAY